MAKSGVTLKKSQMRKLVTQIGTFVEDVAVPYYFQKTQSVMYAALDIQREYMNARVNWTPTGTARKARGGNGPGRVDSGDMRKAIDYNKGRKVAKYTYVHTIGWLNGTPYYAFFQEFGTKNGVQAMESVAYTKAFIEKEMKLRGLMK